MFLLGGARQFLEKGQYFADGNMPFDFSVDHVCFDTGVCHRLWAGVLLRPVLQCDGGGSGSAVVVVVCLEHLGRLA